MLRWLRPPRPDRFERLLVPVWPHLWAFALRLTKDPVRAEDLLHTAVAKALARIDQLREDRAFKVWMTRVVFTTWSHQREKASTRYERPGLENVVVLDPHGVGPERRADQRKLGRQLTEAMNGLPDGQRAAVWLVDAQGFTYAEAAEILGVAPGIAASRVARARSTLRLALRQVALEQGVLR